MTIWTQIRGFVQALVANDTDPSTRHGGHSLAETLRDSTHVRGGQQMAGLGRAGTEAQHKIVAEGHENYTKSFKKKA